MSHYAVAVLTKGEPNSYDIEELMAPYDEAIRVERHISMTRREIIKSERSRRDQSLEILKQYRKDPEKYEKEHESKHIKWIKDTLIPLSTMGDAELYNRFAEWYPKLKDIDPESGEEAIDSSGNLTSTYNEDSKWDWYEIGGRFADELPLLDNGYALSDAALDDVFWPSDELVEKYIKKSKDIYKEYEEFINGSKFYRPEDLIKRFPTPKDYVKGIKAFVPYAVLIEGEGWKEPGRMGWFGMSSASKEEEEKWDETYFEEFIKPRLGHGWWITIVDCHI